MKKILLFLLLVTFCHAQNINYLDDSIYLKDMPSVEEVHLVAQSSSDRTPAFKAAREVILFEKLIEAIEFISKKRNNSGKTQGELALINVYSNSIIDIKAKSRRDYEKYQNPEYYIDDALITCKEKTRTNKEINFKLLNKLVKKNASLAWNEADKIENTNIEKQGSRIISIFFIVMSFVGVLIMFLGIKFISRTRKKLLGIARDRFYKKDLESFEQLQSYQKEELKGKASFLSGCLILFIGLIIFWIAVSQLSEYILRAIF
jgi:hypothetical protein